MQCLGTTCDVCCPWEEGRMSIPAGQQCRAATSTGWDRELGQHSPGGREPSALWAAEHHSSHPQSAKGRQPMTRASLAKYSRVTFELLIIFPFWQPNKCYERVILSIHCTLRVKHVKEEIQIESWQHLLLLYCVESSSET